MKTTFLFLLAALMLTLCGCQPARGDFKDDVLNQGITYLKTNPTDAISPAWIEGFAKSLQPTATLKDAPEEYVLQGERILSDSNVGQINMSNSDKLKYAAAVACAVLIVAAYYL